jgi:hypothetical protein
MRIAVAVALFAGAFFWRQDRRTPFRSSSAITRL